MAAAPQLCKTRKFEEAVLQGGKRKAAHLFFSPVGLMVQLAHYGLGSSGQRHQPSGAGHAKARLLHGNIAAVQFESWGCNMFSNKVPFRC